MISKKPQYGIDGPLVIKRLMLAGIIAFLIGATLTYFFITATITASSLQGALWSSGFWFAIVLMFFSSLYGKFRTRDQLIHSLQLKGDEKILDVGCGRGLLLIASAKQLTTGKAVGIDLWSKEDLSNNNITNTQKNTMVENVSDKIELVTSDMRKMAFEDNIFDVIVSSMAIHNLPSKQDRQKAITEIHRVLKPNGKIVLLDFIHVDDYANTLHQLGWKNVKVSKRCPWQFPPVRILTGTHP